MKTREEVIALFRDKYTYLQAVCQQQIEPFNEAAIYQNPDGGWQLNLQQPGTDSICGEYDYVNEEVVRCFAYPFLKGKLRNNLKNRFKSAQINQAYETVKTARKE